MCVASHVRVGSVRVAMTAVAVVGALVASAGYGVAQTQAAGQPDIEEARRLVEEVFDYQGAVRSLDMVIAMWTASPDSDPDMLAQAYELRGRAHFALDDLDQTRQDFELLLRVRADHVLAVDQLSPPFVQFFDQVKRGLVGSLLLNLSQPIVIAVDGRRVLANPGEVISLVEGEHEIAIREPGFLEVSERFTITADRFMQLTLTVERTSGTLSMITGPDGVSVIVDDVSRGVTPPGAGGGDESSPVLVDDLAPGEHSLRLERECYEPIVTQFGVPDPPGDQEQTLELVPAVATVVVQTTASDAMIYVDGAPRGPAPAELENLCAGQHVIEVRAPSGWFVDRRTWVAGATVTLDVELRPAFAIVEVAGSDAAAAAGLATPRKICWSSRQRLASSRPPPRTSGSARRCPVARRRSWDVGTSLGCGPRR